MSTATRFLMLFIVLVAGSLIAFGCGQDETLTGTVETHAEETETTETGDTTDTVGATGTTEDEGGGEDAAGNVVDIPVKSGTLEFEVTELELEPGTYTLRSENPDALPHNIAIDEHGVSETGELVSNGGVSEITVTLESGKTYEYFCTPHRAAGMVGTITVK